MAVMTVEGEDDKPTFTSDDLAHLSSDEADEGDKGGAGDDKGGQDKGTADGDKAAADKSATDKGAGDDKGEADKAAADGKGGDKGDADKAGKGKTLATGADTADDDKAKDDAAAKAAADKTAAIKKMREDIANHYAAGDKKAFAREMQRLERLGIDNPAKIYGLWRELESKFTSGGLIKVPGKDAKPEEVEAFRKALGVPEKPEDYVKDIKLDNGVVIGEADKPMLDGFTGAMHKVGAPPQIVNAALNWYYAQQEAAAAKLDEADDTFRIASDQALKEEFGPALKRKVNAIASLFATTPGGADAKNENSLYARLLGGRTADGRIIGDDPDVMRFLLGVVSEINPVATVVEDGHQGGMSLDQEIEKIEKIMRDNRREYDTKYSERYRELLEAREKNRARQGA